MRVEFPETVWTMILRAGGGSMGALNRFAGIYRPVVEELATACGFCATDADDLAQETLVALCDPAFLARADRERGRFRDLVFAIARNQMRAAWDRRKRRKEVPLTSGEDLPDAGLEETFRRIWSLKLLELAMARMAEFQVRTPHPPYHTVLRRHRLEGLPLADLARELGTSVTNVKNWVRRAKEHLAEHVCEIVAAYSSTEEEYRDELLLFTPGRPN